MTLLAEDLLLLLLDDDSGARTLDGTQTDLALGGALLLELAMAGQVQVAQDGAWWARENVRAAQDAPPPTDPLLVEALATVAQKNRSPRDLVAKLGTGVRGRLLERLQERGILERRSDRVLGLFPRERWPAVDSRHEDQVRARLRDVLVVGTVPDERTGALTALLHAVGKVDRVVPGLERHERRAVVARATTVAEGAWAADAVRAAVRAAQAAVTAGVMVATTAATTST